jgi:hypothetical protein
MSLVYYDRDCSYLRHSLREDERLRKRRKGTRQNVKCYRWSEKVSCVCLFVADLNRNNRHKCHWQGTERPWMSRNVDDHNTLWKGEWQNVIFRWCRLCLLPTQQAIDCQVITHSSLSHCLSSYLSSHIMSHTLVMSHVTCCGLCECIIIYNKYIYIMYSCFRITVFLTFQNNHLVK